MLWVLLLYALFGSVFTISKTGLEHVQPFFFVGTRMLLAGVLLLAFQMIKNPQELNFKEIPWKKIAGLALFNIYLTNVFEFWGLQYLTSFKTCFIYSLSPFASALISYFVFTERMTKMRWLGLIIGFIGFLPILLNETSKEEQAGHLWIFSWAELAVMAAAICSVYGWILLRQIVKDENCKPTVANGLSMFIGGGFALIHSACVENWNPVPIYGSFFPFVECSFLLIVISNLICYNLYGSLLKKYSATFISFAGFTTPLFTALFGWIYLGEVVTWPFYLSAAIVSSGLFIFYKEELQVDYYKTTLVTEGNASL